MPYLSSPLFYSVLFCQRPQGGWLWVGFGSGVQSHPRDPFDLAGCFISHRGSAFLLRDGSRRMWGPSPQWPELHKLRVTEQFCARAAVVNNNKIALMRMMSKACVAADSDLVSVLILNTNLLLLQVCQIEYFGSQLLLFTAKNSFFDHIHFNDTSELFATQLSLYATTALQESYDRKREPRGGRSKTVREPDPILRNSWHDSLCVQRLSKASAARERCTYRARDRIRLIVCSENLKRFAKISISLGCCRCVQTNTLNQTLTCSLSL